MISQNEHPSEIDIFDPKIHLAYSPPTSKLTMEDLKLQRSPTSTEIAATVPFPILSPEGVLAYRRSLFSPEIIQKCAGSPFPGTVTLRNAATYSNFIRDFWTHPEVLQALSDAAGVPLSVVMPGEIAHTNIQTSGDTIEEMVSGLTAEPSTVKIPLSEDEKAYDPLNAASIIPWHYDSYPYVCVIMLSDTEGMIGGETYIKQGDGVPRKVEGPQLGYGVILQGGEVQHLAARGLGVTERISTITSFTANIPGVYDSSYITNIRNYCDRDMLYKEWTQFRLEKMKREIELLQEQISQLQGPVTVEQIHTFSQSQIGYLKRTARQLIAPDLFDTVLQKHNRAEIPIAAKMWEQAEQLPEFEKQASSVTQQQWMPNNPLWADLAESQAVVDSGQMLESQRGRFKWTKKRTFGMGDELMRQGLPELLLLWMDVTGLYSSLHSQKV